jgi:hypothetical protein
VRRDPLAVREHDLTAVVRLERRLDEDLDAAAGELLRGVVAEARRDLGQDLRRRIDEHPALPGAAQARVPAERVGDEVGQLCQRLDARVAGAHEDEAEMRGVDPALDLRVRGLELAQDPVPELDRVREVLEADGVLGEAGDGERARHGADGKHELLVAHLERARVLRLHLRRLPLLVDLGHVSEQQLGVRAHLPQWHDRVPRLERPRRRLGEQRRVEHEVLGADDRGAAPAEEARDVPAGEAAADHEHPTARLPHPTIVAALGSIDPTYSVH